MLSDLQRSILLFIADGTLNARERFHQQVDAGEQINIVAGYAFALHTDLTSNGHQLQFSEAMLQNRNAKPSDPEFFRNLHALEDFIGLVNGLDSSGTN